MGNLLRLLSRSESSAAVDMRRAVFIDMEFAQPSDSELQQHREVASVLLRAGDILSTLQSYPGAASDIRDAIQEPQNAEAQRRAWQSVQALVQRLLEAYKFSQELQAVTGTLLESLCSAERTAKEHLEQQQALFTQFALIIDFVVRFDEVKMNTPTICNDLSYYRRVHVRQEESPLLTDEESSMMSLFFAQHTPMMRLLTECVGTFMAAHKSLPVNTTSECLAAIADICRGLVANSDLRQRLQKPEETVPLCLRVMVGVCVLYDFVHPLGVFTKDSLLDVRSCIRVLRREQQFKEQCQGLVNVLRYSSNTLNSATTPKSVHALLDE